MTFWSKTNKKNKSMVMPRGTFKNRTTKKIKSDFFFFQDLHNIMMHYHSKIWDKEDTVFF